MWTQGTPRLHQQRRHTKRSEEGRSMKSRLNSAKEMPPSAGSVASSRRTACITPTKHSLNGHRRHQPEHISTIKNQRPLPFDTHSCSTCCSCCPVRIQTACRRGHQGAEQAATTPLTTRSLYCTHRLPVHQISDGMQVTHQCERASGRVRYWQRVCGQVMHTLRRPASTSRVVSTPLPSASSASYVRRRLASRVCTKPAKRPKLRTLRGQTQRLNPEIWD